MEYTVHLCFVKRPRFTVSVEARSLIEASQKALVALNGSVMPKPVGAIVEAADGGNVPQAFRFTKSGTKPCDRDDIMPFMKGHD